MHACQLYTSAPGKSIPAPLPGTGTLHITYSGLGNCDILQELESQTSDPTYRKYYQLACLENDEEVPSDKPTKWKSLCSTILMQKVSGIPPRYNNW